MDKEEEGGREEGERGREEGTRGGGEGAHSEQLKKGEGGGKLREAGVVLT